ncbi:transposase family protein [Streptococcus pneumoniae]|nr:transposase family protein [Streptococcus pneumoniae]
MYQDEAGFGRISKLGSCWSPIGVGPHVHSHYIREFRYCYGAVDAHTGESFFLIAGRCNTEWMNAFLEELSQAYPYDYFLLVIDNAIWHKSSTLKIPTNIGFTFIPPYTPEMNPKTLLKDSRTAKYHKRLQIVLFRLMGKSYKEIIELLDCNQTTIWRNVKNMRSSDSTLSFKKHVVVVTMHI